MKFKRLIIFILIIIWMCTVFFFSSEKADVSGGRSNKITNKIVDCFYTDLNVSDRIEIVERYDFYIRKVAHFSLYAIGGIVLFLFANSYNIDIRKKFAFSFATGVFYAISDEVHQLFVPGRSGQVVDVFIDSMGVILGIMLIIIFLKIFVKSIAKSMFS